MADLLRQQLDEETGIRGFAVVRQVILLQPYYDAQATFTGSFKSIESTLEELHLVAASHALIDAQAMSQRWNDEVATPILDRRPNALYLELHGKQLIDRFRTDIASVDGALAAREATINGQTQMAIAWVGVFVMAAVGVIVGAAFIFSMQQYRLGERVEQEQERAEAEERRADRLRAAYLAEKRIADTLQDAFVQRPLPQLPALLFSATYVPAAEEARIGGDWYDAFELPKDRVLLVIGDVAGHGIDAAVTMNKARQAMLFCALVDDDPASILQRVNKDLVRQQSPIVTAVVGLVDAARYQFSYAAAGHPPPLLLEPGRRGRLLEFGSLPLGVTSDVAYRTHTIQSVPGAMLVLYTDGVIEHTHNILEGEALLLEAAEKAAQSESDNSAMVIRSSVFGNASVADDVAILTIRFTAKPGIGATIATEAERTTFLGTSRSESARRELDPSERLAVELRVA